ncbi:hypothetical protein [Eisenibacter elegans]|uniref:hypothetical protein n=1 Tax=Eisenibacter elegans TaxID=997 RepID=UPI0004261419|nr:hypothetical protein [Eisenibacter elegans]
MRPSLPTILTKLTTSQRWIGGVTLMLLLFGMVWWLWLRPKALREVWDFIPSEPVCVLEVKPFTEAYDQVQRQPFWKVFQQIAPFQEIVSQVNYLHQMIQQEEELHHFFAEQPVFASIHLVSKEELAALLISPLKNPKQLEKFIFPFRINPEYSLTERYFEQFTIQEIRHQPSKQVFSYIMYDGYFIGSYAPLLMEDVLRNLSQGKRQYRFTRNADVAQQLPALKSGYVHLYLNPRKLPALLGLHSRGALEPFFKPLAQYAEASLFNFQAERYAFQLQGRSFSTQDNAEFLRLLDGQSPQPFLMREVVPNQTAVLYHFSFEDNALFFRQLVRYWQQQDPDFGSAQAKTQASYRMDFSAFYELIAKELGMAILQPSGQAAKTNVAILRVTKEAKMKELLERWAKEVARNQGASLETATYQGQTITRLDVPNFPAILLGNLFADFPTVYYTIFKGYLLMADSEPGIRRAITAIQERDVWRYSARRDLFKDRNATFRFFVQTSKIWEIIYRQASPAFQALMTQYAGELRFIDYLSLQTGRAGAHYDTKVTVQFQQKAPSRESNKYYKTLANQYFTRPLRTAPFTPEPYPQNIHKVLVQDMGNDLYLLSEKGNIVWKKNLGGALVTPLQSLDLLNNNQQQLFYLTRDRIGALDLQGNAIPGFPVFPPQKSKLETLAVFKVQPSNTWHWLVSNAEGALYLYNENRQLQKGWNPKTLDSPLGPAARYVYIDDQSYLLTIQENGRVSIFDLQGQYLQGFPLKLSGTISSPPWVQIGANLEQSNLTCLTEGGQLITINFKGEVQQIRKLIRLSDNSFFSLIPNQGMTDFVVGAQDAAHLRLYNPSGDLLFERDFEKDGTMDIQFFSFDDGLSFFAITNRAEERTYFLMPDGSPAAPPVESTLPIAISFTPIDNHMVIHRVYKTDVGSLQLN